MKKWLMAISISLILMSAFFMYKGFDYKNQYKNSEYSILNKNAYVGGDAYNYIINGTYFTGYMALAGSFMISGLLCFIGANVIKEKEIENDEVKESE